MFGVVVLAGRLAGVKVVERQIVGHLPGIVQIIARAAGERVLVVVARLLVDAGDLALGVVLPFIGKAAAQVQFLRETAADRVVNLSDFRVVEIIPRVVGVVPVVLVLARNQGLLDGGAHLVADAVAVIHTIAQRFSAGAVSGILA